MPACEGRASCLLAWPPGQVSSAGWRATGRRSDDRCIESVVFSLLEPAKMLASLVFAEDTLRFADCASAASPAEDAKTACCVRTRLMHSHYAPLRADVRCDCREGMVTLAGNLPSFFLVQVALSVALHAPGVLGVINRIRVG